MQIIELFEINYFVNNREITVVIMNITFNHQFPICGQKFSL